MSITKYITYLSFFFFEKNPYCHYLSSGLFDLSPRLLTKPQSISAAFLQSCFLQSVQNFVGSGLKHKLDCFTSVPRNTEWHLL